MLRRILVGLCLPPPWKDWSSVIPVSYLLTMYEHLRYLRGLRWHYVSVFRQLNPRQCCNWAFKSVCPNVENKHLSSVLFLSLSPLPSSSSCEEICGNNWIAEQLMSTGCSFFMVPLLIFLHPGCLSLRSGCALFFLAAALGAGGKAQMCGHWRRVLCPRGCLRPGDGGNGSVGAPWVCSPHGMDLSREVLKGSMVPVDKVQFQDCAMEVSQHRLWPLVGGQGWTGLYF